MKNEPFIDKDCFDCGRTFKGRAETQCPYCHREKKWNELNFQSQIGPLTNIPGRVMIEFKIMKTPKKYLPKSGSVYFHGEIRKGKTFLAVRLAWERRKLGMIEATGGPSIKFIKMLDYYELLRETFFNPKLKEEITAIRDCDLLIFDDLTTISGTDWSYDVLYHLISHRYDEMKDTIFTSNLSLPELQEKIKDARLIRRIEDMCGDNIFEIS